MPERKTITSNSMIVVLFGRKGCVVKAQRLFDRIEGNYMVSWSAMISCYKQNGMCEEAFFYYFFANMNANGIMVDEMVVVSVISACTSLSIVMMGRLVHGLTDSWNSRLCSPSECIDAFVLKLQGDIGCS
ncbi:putative pentatricopeptide [Medicago truncatula]|uniref:Putative pentatricopeptide n=1 Tax=Medicago truncatula TaxID=3880 RepID=A0A396IUB2_MEDTR|nr:putative pentatricopeptide [Medicago truncatula]